MDFPTKDVSTPSSVHPLVTILSILLHFAFQVMKLVKETHYQLACTHYFELTHSVEDQPGFNHPNQFYEESRKIHAGDAPSSQNRGNQTPRVNVKKEAPTSEVKSEDTEAFEELDDMQLMEVDEMMAMT